MLHFDQNFSEICSKGPIDNIGSDNCLLPVWCQAIIWTSDSLVPWCLYASLSHELILMWQIILIK